MTVSRVRYLERQVLRVQDLAEEQSYRHAMQVRHELGAHKWGIVSGLSLWSHEEGVFIQPGVAVDGYGRQLIISEPVLVKTAVLAHSELGGTGSKIIDVFLVYHCIESQQGRLQEEARIRLESAADGADPIDPYQLSGIPDDPIPFAVRDPNHDNQPWPVYLGRVHWNEVVSIVEIVPVTRPLAALRGEKITAVSGQTQMQIGGERSGDPNRFTVALADHKNEWDVRLSIDQEGKTAVYGETEFTQSIRFATSNILLKSSEILNPTRLTEKLRDERNPLSKFILSYLPEYKEEKLRIPPLQASDQVLILVDAFNYVIEKTILLYTRSQPLFFNQDMDDETRQLLISKPSGSGMVRLNRWFLENWFTGEFKQYEGEAIPAALSEVQLQTDDILKPANLLNKLRNKEDVVAVYILSQFSTGGWEVLQSEEITEGMVEEMVVNLNQILENAEFVSTVLSQRKIMDRKTRQFMTQDLVGPDLLRLNRHILNVWYPGEFAELEDVVDQERGLSFASISAPPETAVPWKIYRTIVENEEERLKQLRIEIGDPNSQGDPANSQLVIGYQEPETENFITCFTVAADGNVTVHGDLQMQPGNVISEGPITIDLSDERFTSQLLSNWVGGLSTAAPQVDAAFNTPLELSISGAPQTVERGSSFNYSGMVKSVTTKTEIYGMTVYELVAIEGRSSQQREIIGPFDFVGTKKSEMFASSSDAIKNVDSRVRNASLIVTVIGRTASGQQVQATATKSIQVIDPQPKG